MFGGGFSNNATTDLGYALTASNGGWRDGSDNSVSEMGYMYYVNLGNLGRCTPNAGDPSSCIDQVGWGLDNTGPFTNIQSFSYWSDTERSSPSAWYFRFEDGRQDDGTKLNNYYAWAVHDGNIGDAVVPIPHALLLFFSGLIGLVGMARRRS
jgi:hypothetical protein